MKGFFSRLQTTLLVISAVTTLISLVYSAVKYLGVRSSRATLQTELDASRLKISEYKQGIGKNLPSPKDGKPPFDPSKYLYDNELPYEACLSAGISGGWTTEECRRVLSREAHTGPWVDYALRDLIDASADVLTGLYAGATGVLIVILTLFLSWLFTGKIRIRP